MRNFLSPSIDRAKVYLLAGLVVAGVVRNAGAQLVPATGIVSVGSGGTAGNNDARMPRISRSGRYVTFASAGGYGLVGGNRTHIFVRDLGDDTLTHVSKTPAGTAANNDSFDPVISDDGRRVAFMSWATNLHPLDTNGNADVYFHDRQTNKTYLVSATPDGSSGDNVSTDPEMTPDGRYVVFRSQATNLVAGDANASFDVFRRDLLLEVTEIVSVDASGVQATAGSSFCSISADGRWVAFQSSANNLVGTETDSSDDIFVKDMLTGAVEQVSIRHDGTMMNSPCTAPFISDDGTKVAYMTDDNFVLPGQTSGYRDIFVYDRTNGSVVCASLTSTNGTANQHVVSGRMSRDGAFVAFENGANLIVPGDNNNLVDVFLRDLTLGTTTLCSVSTAAPTAALGGNSPDVAVGGRRIVFYSASDQVVGGDINGQDDVFLRDLEPWAPYSYCLGKVNSLGCRPAMAASGQSSATAISGFVLSATDVLNSRPGLLLYSISGTAAVPFQGGTLCIASPIGRTPPTNSGGTPGPALDCSGVLSLDFNAFALGLLGGNPFFELQIPGTRVCAQWWSRDPGYPSTQASSLADGLSFVIRP